MVRRIITKYSSVLMLVLTGTGHQAAAASLDFNYSGNFNQNFGTFYGDTYVGEAYNNNGWLDAYSDRGAITNITFLSNGTTIASGGYRVYGRLDEVGASGSLLSDFAHLSPSRKTTAFATNELNAPVGFRWFDSFTNDTNQTVTSTIRFSGELASGANTRVSYSDAGFVITTDGSSSQPASPTIAHVYSDTTYANQVNVHAIDGDRNIYFDYNLTVAPGETVSILLFNYLMADPDRLTDPAGATQREIELGRALATGVINSPYLAGLTLEQIASIVNFNVALDGSLPSAGAPSQIAGTSLALFNNLLDVNQAFTSAGAQLAFDNVSPLAYVPVTKNEGAAQIASLIGQSGGKLTSGTDEHQLYMLGGYSKGKDQSADADLNHSGYALALGYEFATDPSSRYGVALGYMNSTAEIAGSYSDISGEQFLVSPYARWNLAGDVTIDARASLSSDNWSYIRKAGALDASAKFDGYTLGASLKASKAFETAGVTITPFAKFSTLHSHFNTFEEQGGGIANLEVPSYRVTTFEALAGIGLSESWLLDNINSLSAFANVSIGKGFSSDKSITTRYAGSSLYYDSLIEGKDDLFGRLDLGASLQLSKSTDLMLTYSGQFTQDSTQHALSSKLSVKF